MCSAYRRTNVKIECPHLKHLEDVIKPQEEEVREACVDIHLATARHMNRIKWVSWIIQGEEAPLCRNNMIMESTEIPSMVASAFVGTIGCPVTWINGTCFISTRSTLVEGGWLLEPTLPALLDFLTVGLFLCFFLVRSGAGGSVRPSLSTTPSVARLSIGRLWLSS